MLWRIFGALAAVAALVPAGTQAPVVPVSLIPEFAIVRPGTTFRVAVRIEVPEGWHIGWKHPGQTGLPTTIAWRVPPEISVGRGLPNRGIVRNRSERARVRGRGAIPAGEAGRRRIGVEGRRPRRL